MKPVTVSYEPIEIAIALSLYQYNVSAKERVTKLVHHFDSVPNHPGLNAKDMLCYFKEHDGATIVTALPYATAKVYVEHALEVYGKAAQQRVACEEAYKSGKKKL